MLIQGRQGLLRLRRAEICDPGGRGWTSRGGPSGRSGPAGSITEAPPARGSADVTRGGSAADELDEGSENGARKARGPGALNFCSVLPHLIVSRLRLLPGAAMFGVRAALRVILDPARLLRRGVALGDGHFRGDHVPCILRYFFFLGVCQWSLLSRRRFSGQNPHRRVGARCRGPEQRRTQHAAY